jgi:hypothetical protein
MKETSLAAALNAAFTEKRAAVVSAYDKAIADCDEAWRAVEGALSNRPVHINLVTDAIKSFRGAYDRKLALASQRNYRLVR